MLCLSHSASTAKGFSHVHYICSFALLLPLLLILFLFLYKFFLSIMHKRTQLTSQQNKKKERKKKEIKKIARRWEET